MTGMCRGIAGPVHAHKSILQVETVRDLLRRNTSSLCVAGAQTNGSFIVKRQPQGNERKLPFSKSTNFLFCVIFDLSVPETIKQLRSRLRRADILGGRSPTAHFLLSSFLLFPLFPLLIFL